jgi:hypothetical protein
VRSDREYPSVGTNWWFSGWNTVGRVDVRGPGVAAVLRVIDESGVVWCGGLGDVILW